MDTAIVTAVAGIFGSLLGRLSKRGDFLGHSKNVEQAERIPLRTHQARNALRPVYQ